MKYFKITIGILTVLAASRFIPHPPNFTSAIALSFYVPAIFGLKFIIVPTGESKFKDQKSLNKKILFYENEINFFNEKLKNRDFLNKAPPKIIDQHKFKLEEAKRNLKLLTQK